MRDRSLGGVGGWGGALFNPHCWTSRFMIIYDGQLMQEWTSQDSIYLFRKLNKYTLLWIGNFFCRHNGVFCILSYTYLTLIYPTDTSVHQYDTYAVSSIDSSPG